MLATAVAAAVTFLAYLRIHGIDQEKVRRGCQWGQVGSGAPVIPDSVNEVQKA